ncbi:PAS domain-containing protein [Uliginosibacterium sp. 31-12]|uniref:PAS domain-containing hybrid sensor histidine kinase/response regulator n=1 Tax=Uliginosibacterium sp. 31-12 TaxID=3062781 RepID=UPI0026E37AC7|nr:PAS domain-containing protein [Uliginosibacterium sp. 31-12]MDO6385892.1 PAS domain-containing protein [Uliginosibacterium sp. 31-12]
MNRNPGLRWQLFLLWLLCGTAGTVLLGISHPELWLALTGTALAWLLPGALISVWLIRRAECREADVLAFFQRVLDVIPHPVYLKDADSRYILVNDAFVHDKRRSREALLGSHGIEATHAESIRLQREEDLAVLAGIPLRKEEHKTHSHTGAEVFRLVAKGCCTDSAGAPVIVGSHIDITELRQAQRELAEAADRERQLRRRTQEFTQRLIDVIPAPVYVRSVEGYYLLVNESFMRERGRSMEEILSNLAWASEETAERVKAEDALVLAGEAVLKEEHVPHPDTGAERFRLISKRACEDTDGHKVIVGANFDITPWRQAERERQSALEREQAFHRATQVFIQRILDMIPDPVYVKDAAGRYILVNEAFARERAMPPEEILGSTALNLTGELEARETSLREDAEVLAGSEIFKEQHSTHPVSGAEVFRVVSKRRSTDSDGQPVIVGAHFDLTRWKLAERSLQQSLERERELRERVQTFTQRLIDVIPQPVYVKDAQSRYIMVNEAFAEDQQRPASELLGATPEMFPGDAAHVQLVREEDARVLSGEVLLKEERRRHALTGRDSYRLISKRSSLDAEGNPVIVGANFNITSWREAEERAARASEAKSIFLASMSHEIRTPLSGVIGMLRIALRREALSETARDKLSICLANAEHLLAIINDILDFSKIEAGQLSLENIDFALRPMLEEAMQPFQVHAQAASLYFRIELDPALPSALRGDPTRLRQILMNLVSNALKFTEQGEICLRVQSLITTGGQCTLRFAVEDTGIGIPSEALPRLFEQFQQADASTTRRYGGTGLGLAICRQLVDAMGGQITVQSQVGVGSSFSFVLSLPVGTLGETQKASPLAPHARRLRILCAEDSPTNQLIVQDLLEEMGHHVDIVANGFDAITALARRDYDLVLMDGRMPQMDGIEATRAIRAGGLPEFRVRKPHIPIIAITANASEDDRQQCLDTGMDDFLTKPINEHKLHTMLAAWIERIEPPPAPHRTTHHGGSYTPSPRKGDFVTRLRSMFDAELPQRISEIERAMDAEDFTSLARQFHSIRGGAVYTGDEHLLELAEVLEANADQHDLPSVRKLWPQYRRQLEETVASRASAES